MLQLETITTQSFDSSGIVSDVLLNMERKQENVNIFSISFFYELEKVWKSVVFFLRPLPIMSAVHLLIVKRSTHLPSHRF